MSKMQLGQLDLFEVSSPQIVSEAVSPAANLLTVDGGDIGTFKDSLRAPIHRWFKYPAGYSYKLVEQAFKVFGVGPGQGVYDPFSGTGTTILTAKRNGISGVGIEAHIFVHWVAETKLYWDFDSAELSQWAAKTLKEARRKVERGLPKSINLSEVFPELIHKCYHPVDLQALYLIREYGRAIESKPHQNLFNLALTDTLRSASTAGTGWPYIAPRESNGSGAPKNAFSVFQNKLLSMVGDLQTVIGKTPPGLTRNILGDSRRCESSVADARLDLAVTSPPYLNNYDYADRTRLEMYFFGWASSWGDITREVRDKLMMAATTQVRRANYDLDNILRPELAQHTPEIYRELRAAVSELSRLRHEKAGKKDYDIMVAQYFNDMYDVLRETYRVLKPGAAFVLVLGDSAPYGVYVPTGRYIAEIACSSGIGFSSFQLEALRKRGGKWPGNPQRHKVPLAEGTLILRK